MKVNIIGAGYVGITTGVLLAYLGHRVTLIDIDAQRVDALSRHQPPIHEPHLEQLLADVRERLSVTLLAAALPSADVWFLTIGTPEGKDGRPALQALKEAAYAISGSLDGRLAAPTVVIKSTVPPGTNRQVRRWISERTGRNKPQGWTVVSNPEFLREGAALFDSLYPSRVVVGTDDAQGEAAMRTLYAPLLEQTFKPPDFQPRPEGYKCPDLIVCSPVDAELIKYAANAFLATKISFINEVAELCEQLGADVNEVARGIGGDPRIGPHFLAAGLGWGGSCFPKDTAALVAVGREYGMRLPIVQAARTTNEHQIQRTVARLEHTLGSLSNEVVAVLGLAFKPGTDDIRGSQSIRLVRRLVDRGAIVRVHDPIAVVNATQELGRQLAVTFCEDPYAAAEGATVLVLATDWPEYGQLELDRIASVMKAQPLLLDGRNMYSRSVAEHAGFTYMGVGR